MDAIIKYGYNICPRITISLQIEEKFSSSSDIDFIVYIKDEYPVRIVLKIYSDGLFYIEHQNVKNAILVVKELSRLGIIYECDLFTTEIEDLDTLEEVRKFIKEIGIFVRENSTLYGLIPEGKISGISFPSHGKPSSIMEYCNPGASIIIEDCSPRASFLGVKYILGNDTGMELQINRIKHENDLLFLLKSIGAKRNLITTMILHAECPIALDLIGSFPNLERFEIYHKNKADAVVPEIKCFLERNDVKYFRTNVPWVRGIVDGRKLGKKESSLLERRMTILRGYLHGGRSSLFYTNMVSPRVLSIIKEFL